MFKIQVRKELIDHCSLQVEQYNFGQRGYADGTKDQQLTGVIGQSQIAELFGEPWVTGEGGFDDGQDLLYKGLVIDVKTMGRTTDVRPYYVNNFVGLQKRLIIYMKLIAYVCTKVNNIVNHSVLK